MSRLMRRTPRTAGPEIDNVIEREAGLRSVREAAGILGIGDDAVLARRRYPHDTSPARRHAWMTPTERRRHIRDQLEARRSVRVSTLSAQLGVSQMTIRRDLARLEAEGCLTRSYGGAMSNSTGADLVTTARRD